MALRLADLFAEVIGVNADRGMIEEAIRATAMQNLTNLRWFRLRAEELPAGLGIFRYATFAQSFHWMDRQLVATRVFDMLEPGGAFVHVGGQEIETPSPSSRVPIRCRQPMTSGVSSSRTSDPSAEPVRE